VTDHQDWTAEQWLDHFRSLGMSEDRAQEAAAISMGGRGCLPPDSLPRSPRQGR
jgi:hypothetical protein